MACLRIIILTLLLNFPIFSTFVIQNEPCVMEATFENGSIDSGDVDIHHDAPWEGRIYVDDGIAKNSKYSVVHQLYKSDPLVAGMIVSFNYLYKKN